MTASVLVVDDEKNIRRTVRMVLEGEGFTVDEAKSGEQALALVSDLSPDAVLLDVQLPGISGLTTLEKLGERFKGIEAPAVIMISGHGTLRDAVRAVKAGAFDFLDKPLDRDRLIVTLRNGLERQAMAREVAELRSHAPGEQAMLGSSPAMEALKGRIAKVAATKARVLITGESGTGKELVARAIHRASTLRDQVFVKVNCAAIASELIESELFGHEKGAFTGATQRKRGYFEQADGGTIFLDEIGDMSLAAQAKVLRVLQSGDYTRVGGEHTLHSDVRVLAATNRDLEQAVSQGAFREDLYFRLSVVPLRTPPLRERLQDVHELVQHFAITCARENNMRPKDIHPDAMRLLAQHNWPGNIRELRNVVERLVILSEDIISVGDLPEEIVDEVVRTKEPLPQLSSGLAWPLELNEVPLRDFRDTMERNYILSHLERLQWNISQTAAALGIERTNLHKRMKSLQIARDGRKASDSPETPTDP